MMCAGHSYVCRAQLWCVQGTVMVCAGHSYDVSRAQL